jgi:Reverse transcriptase (RNA-dependent DNA polymerase)
MSDNKSAGLDGITAEHLKYAHPSLVVALKNLFNLVLSAQFVPDDFGRGITIPIPKNGDKAFAGSKDFRGITINPVISKVFECCLLDKVLPYLSTSSRQFGFKKGVSCANAIFMVKQTVDYFTTNDSTVNVVTLDLASAFDKISHFRLFLILMTKQVPVSIIRLLYNWYSKVISCVKWNDTLSKPFQLYSGVRQGGNLSPALFSVFVNELLNILKDSKLGCYVKGVCTNSFMYADDIILLTISLDHMRKIVDICTHFFDNHDLGINVSKCKFLRIGLRHKIKCSNIKSGTDYISVAAEIKYLGVVIVSAKEFRCCYSENRKKFFRSFNCMYGRISKADPSVILSLLNAQCVPTLLYGAEVAHLTKYEQSRLVSAYDRAFMKIFSTWDLITVRLCQYYAGMLPLNYQIDYSKCKFALRFALNESIDNCHRDIISSNSLDLQSIIMKYGITSNDTLARIYDRIRTHFIMSLSVDGLM